MPGRLLLAGLALLLSACTTTGGSPASPTAPAVDVPQAVPAGAVYGRLMDAEGRSVPGGSVTLSQPFDDNVVLFSVRLVSLGLFCLIPDAELCPSFHGADVSDDGLWSVPAEDVEPGKALTLSGHGLDPAEGTGAHTSVSVPNGTAPFHVPDLVLWQPTVRVTPAAGGARVTWPRLVGVPHGRGVRYDVAVTTDASTIDEPVLVGRGLRRTSAVVPGWQVEDQPFRVTVVAATRRGKAAYVYTAPSTSGAGAAVPLSRGRPCSTDRRRRQVRAVGACPLTDGDLDSHEQVRLKGECDVDVSGCRPPRHTRICVDLGRARTVRRVVVRSPFLAVDQVVETSLDGRSFTRRGAFADTPDGDTSGVFVVGVPAARARWVCASSKDYGYSGANLSEISAW